MEEYYISYHSFNDYDTEVREGIYEFIVMPCVDETQTIKSYRIENDHNEKVFSYRNIFGFRVHRIRYTGPFNYMHFSLNCFVQKAKFNPYDFKQLSIEEESKLLHSDEFLIENHFYLYPTDFTHLSNEAQKKIFPYMSDHSVFDYCSALNKYIYEEYEYESDVTTVDTKAEDVINLGKGVCQDFTHIFIAMCRYNKIPARYTSGYLNQGKNFKGAAMMHAWAEVLIPGVGWIGFDPTNNILADENYIKIAHGVDYRDCSPIKGILKTNGGNTTRYQVSVTTNKTIHEQQQQQQQ